MKITILGTAHPFRGGMADFNERLAIAFQEQGHTVKIENFSLQYPAILFPGKTQYSESPKPENLDINSKMSSINPLTWIKVGKKLKTNKPDIIIVGYWLPFMAPCLGTICKIAKKNKHTKIVGLLHNILPHESRIGDKRLSKYFTKHIDSFISLSKSVLKDLDIFDTIKPRAFNPHPIYDSFGEIEDKEIATHKLKLDNNFKYILFFGLIRDYKGLDLLLNAFNKKGFAERKIKLIIAGEFYGNKEHYIKLIDNNINKKDIILHDWFIPKDDVANYFNSADLIVQPYKNATQSGITQIAYHFNKPMIVTNVGGLPEICPDGKVGYVADVDSKDIAKKIFKFFDNNLKDEMQLNIQEEKKKYSWDILANKIIKLSH